MISKVLVSQPEPTHEHSPFARLSEKTGVEFVFRPFIRVEGLSAYEFRKQKVDITKCPFIIFTSRAAIDHFFRIAEELRYQVPDETRYFCLSEQIALYLQKYIVYRKRKIFFSEDGTEQGLIVTMDKYRNERFLFPTSEVFSQKVPRELKKEGIKYTKAVLYRTVSSDLSDVELSQFDMLVFYSPLGIRSLQENFPDFEQGDTIIAAFGKGTHAAVKAAGLALQIPVPTPRCLSMTDALEHYILEHNEQ